MAPESYRPQSVPAAVSRLQSLKTLIRAHEPGPINPTKYAWLVMCVCDIGAFALDRWPGHPLIRAYLRECLDLIAGHGRILCDGGRAIECVQPLPVEMFDAAATTESGASGPDSATDQESAPEGLISESGPGPDLPGNPAGSHPGQQRDRESPLD